MTRQKDDESIVTVSVAQTGLLLPRCNCASGEDLWPERRQFLLWPLLSRQENPDCCAALPQRLSLRSGPDDVALPVYAADQTAFFISPGSCKDGITVFGRDFAENERPVQPMQYGRRDKSRLSSVGFPDPASRWRCGA